MGTEFFQQVLASSIGRLGSSRRSVTLPRLPTCQHTRGSCMTLHRVCW